jgi:hypothetical protein
MDAEGFVLWLVVHLAEIANQDGGRLVLLKLQPCVERIPRLCPFGSCRTNLTFLSFVGIVEGFPITSLHTTSNNQTVVGRYAPVQ